MPTNPLIKNPPILRSLAERAAHDPQIEQAVLGAIRAVLPMVIEGLLCDTYPGETVRLYARKGLRDDQRVARDRRIRADAAGGAPVALIAEREHVTVRHIRRLLAAK